MTDAHGAFKMSALAQFAGYDCLTIRFPSRWTGPPRVRMVVALSIYFSRFAADVPWCELLIHKFR
jgi:hypothetical protein